VIRGGRDGSEDNRSGPGSQQRVASCEQRGAGGDDVVDDQHPWRPAHRARPEVGTVEPFGAAASGLARAVMAKQHPPARFAPQCAKCSGEQFGLVVASLADMAAGGRRPRDDIDLGGVETSAELLGEVHRQAAAVAVLETNHEFTSEPGELGGGDDAGGRGDRRRSNQRKSAPPAQIDTRFATPCASTVQHG